MKDERIIVFRQKMLNSIRDFLVQQAKSRGKTCDGDAIFYSLTHAVEFVEVADQLAVDLHFFLESMPDKKTGRSKS